MIVALNVTESLYWALLGVTVTNCVVVALLTDWLNAELVLELKLVSPP